INQHIRPVSPSPRFPSPICFAYLARQHLYKLKACQYNLPMTSKAPPLLKLEFDTVDFQQHLYQHYRDFHQHTPVFMTAEGIVYVTRYDDCVQVLGNREFLRCPPDGGSNPFDDRLRAPSPLEVMIRNWMIFMDPPRHDIVRKAFMKGFTSRAIKDI